jgi:hypothetical protein
VTCPGQLVYRGQLFPNGDLDHGWVRVGGDPLGARRQVVHELSSGQYVWIVDELGAYNRSRCLN